LRTDLIIRAEYGDREAIEELLGKAEEFQIDEVVRDWLISVLDGKVDWRARLRAKPRTAHKLQRDIEWAVEFRHWDNIDGLGYIMRYEEGLEDKPFKPTTRTKRLELMAKKYGCSPKTIEAAIRRGQLVDPETQGLWAIANLKRYAKE
jgi:hypothetical protein